MGISASRHNWDQSNTAGHDDFAPCLNSGWAKFVQSGRDVQRRSARMADICGSVRRRRYCRPRLRKHGTLRARRLLMRTKMAGLLSPRPRQRHLRNHRSGRPMAPCDASANDLTSLQPTDSLSRIAIAGCLSVAPSMWISALRSLRATRTAQSRCSVLSQHGPPRTGELRAPTVRNLTCAVQNSCGKQRFQPGLVRAWARARTDPPVLSKNDPGSL